MYIPQSQYKTGFYSYSQFSLDSEPYTGPYWELINGEKYTGETPSSNSKLLSKLIQPPTEFPLPRHPCPKSPLARGSHSGQTWQGT
jgi:hypothetical protein